MAAVVAGNSLGLSNTSLFVLGAKGALGSASQGRAGERVYVNSATGNLVIQNRDELVLGRGPDLSLLRTYNSQGLLNDDNGDNWRLGIYRRVFALTGTANTAGSTVRRLDADGAESVYTFNTTLGKYVCSEGDGAYDTLGFNSGTQTWTWTDGDSQVTERYDAANVGRITQVLDTDGSGLTFTYNATSGLITQVSDASGESTFLDYTGANLTQLRTVNSGGQTLVRTSYAYDASNRLVQVTTDLTPEITTDAVTYTVSYTYDGTSKRVASMTQSDGSSLAFTYTGTDFRVATITDALGRVTSFAYNTAARTTTVTDPLSLATVFAYDTAGQLTSITAPAVGGVSQVVRYAYDAQGNVVSVTDAKGNVVTYGYDAGGNRVLERDAAGNTVTRVYGARNELLAETISAGMTTTVTSSTGETWTLKDGAKIEGTPPYLSLPGIAGSYASTPDSPANSITGDIEFVVKVAPDSWNSGVIQHIVAKRSTDNQSYALRIGADGRIEVVKGSATGGTTVWIAASSSAPSLVAGQAKWVKARIDVDNGASAAVISFWASDDGLAWTSLGSATLAGAAGPMFDGTNSLEVGAAFNGIDRPFKGRIYYADIRNGIDGPIVAKFDPSAGVAQQTVAPATARYVYDGENHLRFVVSAEGRVTEYRYNDFGQQIAAIQYTGNLYSLTGLNPGDALTETQLNSWVGTADKTKTLRSDSTYDFRGQVETTTTYASVDAAGNGVANGTQAVRQYVYDQAGNLLKTVDPRGVATTTVPNDFTTTYVYDGLGRVLSTVDALGRTTFTQYQDANRKTVLTFANGLVSTSTYDATGNLVSVLQSANSLSLGETKYFYDANGRLRRTEDPTGIKVYILYDEAGRKIGEIDGDGSLAEYRYDAAGNLTRTIRYATAVSGLNLDSLTDASTGKPTTVALAAIRPAASAADRSRWNAYDTANRLVESVDEAGAVTQYFYDGADRLTDVVHFATVIATATLGDAPTAASINPASNAADRRSRSFYDAEGRLRGSLDGEGYLVENKYDAGGQLVETVEYATATSAALRATGTLAQLVPAASANDVRSYNVYNARGQLVRSIDAEGYLTEYSYDAAENRTGETRYAIKTNERALALTGVSGVYANTPDSPANSITGDIEFVVKVAPDSWNSGVIQHIVAKRSTDNQSYALRVGADGRIEVVKGSATGGTTVWIGASSSAPSLVAGQAKWVKARIDVDNGAAAAVINFWASDDGFAWTSLGSATLAGAAGPMFDGTNSLEVGAAFNGIDRPLKGKIYYADIRNGIDGPIVAKFDPAIDAPAAASTSFKSSTGEVWTLNGAASIGTLASAQDQVKTYAYDALNRVTSERAPDGTETQYVYDEVGNLTKTVRAVGAPEQRTLTAQYDKQGRLTKELSAEGAAQLTGGQTQAQIDAIWTAYGMKHTYDAAGRRTSTTDANGKRTLFFYNADGALTHTINALGEVRQSVYNALGQVTQTIAYGTRIAQTTLATLSGGLNTELAGVTANVLLDSKTSYAYALTGALAQMTDPLGNAVTQAFNAFGELAGSTQAIGGGLTLEHAYSYDRRGLLTLTRWDPAGLDTSAATVYDAFGRAIQSTDARGNVRTQSYDRLGRTVTSTDALNQATSATYDAFDRVLTRTDALGKVTSYSYNTASRSVTVTTPENIATTTVKNRHGEAISVTDGRNSTTTYSYDANSNLTGVTAPAVGTVTSAYDNANLLIETTDALGTKTSYTYDAANRVLTRTVDPGAGRLNLATTYEYDAQGQTVSVTDPAGVVTKTTFDLKGQLTEVAVDPAGFNLRTAYSYDARGKMLTVTEGAGSAQPRVTRYGYDKLGRRTSEQVDGIATATTYVYDKNDNVIRKTDALGNVTRYVYDAADRLVYTVNALGYVTETQYDEEGRVASTIDHSAPVFVSDLPSLGEVQAAFNLTATTTNAASNYFVAPVQPFSYSATANRDTASAATQTVMASTALSAVPGIPPIQPYTYVASAKQDTASSATQTATASTAFSVLPGTGWQGAQLIETNSGGTGRASIGLDAQGNAIAVWEQGITTNPDSRTDIYANRYVAATGTWQGAQLIETNNAGGANGARIALDAQGNAIAVWRQDDEIRGRTDIYANRYVAATGTWQGAQVINDLSGGGDPHIAFDSQGNAIVAWVGSAGTAGTLNIYAKRYVAATGTWQSAQVIETNNGNVDSVSIALDAQDNAVVAWVRSDVLGTHRNLYVNRYVAATGVWQGAQLIDANDSGAAYGPRIALDAQGNAIAVWQKSDGTRNDIYANRYFAATGVWQGAQLIETNNLGDAFAPNIAFGAQGNAIAVWVQFDGTRYNVYANRYLAATGAWQGAQLIETDDRGSAVFPLAPDIAFDGYGNAIAVWIQSDGTSNSVYANRYAAATGTWQGVQLLETSALSINAFISPRIAFDSRGNAIAVWNQSANIFANRYNADIVRTTLSWPASVQPAGTTATFGYRRAGTTGAYTSVTISANGANQQVVLDQLPAGSYEYRVDYTDSFGRTLKSTDSSFTVSGTVGTINTSINFAFTQVTSTVVAGSSIAGYIAASDVPSIDFVDATVTNPATGAVVSTARTYPEFESSYNGAVNLSVGAALPTGSYTVAISVRRKTGVVENKPAFTYEVGLQNFIRSTVSWPASVQPTGTTASFGYRRAGTAEAYTSATVSTNGTNQQVVLDQLPAGSYDYQVNYTDSFGRLLKSANSSFTVSSTVSTTNTGVNFNFTQVTSTSIAGSSIAGYIAAIDVPSIDKVQAVVTDTNGTVVSTALTYPEFEANYNGNLNLKVGSVLADGRYTVAVTVFKKNGTVENKPAFTYEIGMQPKTDHLTTLSWSAANQPADIYTRFSYAPLGSNTYIDAPVVRSGNQNQVTITNPVGGTYQYFVRYYQTTTDQFLKEATGQFTATAAIVTTSATLPFQAAADRTIKRYVYDGDGRELYCIDALGGVTQKTYDANGNLVREVRYANPIPLTTALDPAAVAGAVALVAGGDDRTVRTVYDAANRATFTIDAAGSVTQITYDSAGNAVKEVRYANALQGTFTDNVAPQIVSAPAASGSYVIVNAASAAKDRVTRSIYDAAGRKRYEVDAEGYVTERRFDPLGHEITRIRYPTPVVVGDGATVADMVNLIPSVPATAVLEQAVYDKGGRLTDVIDGENVRTKTAYDAVGRKIDVTRAFGTAAASTIHYVYDAAGRLIEETAGYGSADAATTRYGLDALGNRRSIIDARGIELAETDSAWALATRSNKLAASLTATEKNDYLGKYTTTQEFDALGRRKQVKNAVGGITLTEYDAFGNAVKITDPRGNIGYFYFDRLDRATLQVDPEGYVTESRYENAFANATRTVRYANRVVGTVSPSQPPAIVAAPAASGPYVLIDPARDQTTVVQYDKRDLRLKVTDAESWFEQYEYDAFGNKKSYRNKLGGVTSYDYDRVGNLKSETLPINSLNALGQSVPVVNTYEYDERGNRRKQTEAFGLPEQRVTEFVYDKLDRQVKKLGEAVHVFNATTNAFTDTGIPTEQTKYDARGNVIETIASNGARTLTWYDALDRRSAELGAEGTFTEWKYNDGKAVVTELRYGDPVALPTTAGGTPPLPVNDINVREKRYTYDANYALTETLVPDVVLAEKALGSDLRIFEQSVVTRSVYDANGNEVLAVDGRGKPTFRYYDRLGQKILEVDRENFVTRWERDASGEVVRETRYSNKLSLLSSVSSDPAALIRDVDRGATDPVTGLPYDPLKRVTEFEYDRMSRVLERRVLGVAFATLDAAGDPIPATGISRTQMRYNGLGQITQQTDATGSVSETGYDAAGRKTREQGAQFTDFEGAPVRPTTDYEYDGLNQVKREIDRGKNAADDRITAFQYDYGFGARQLRQTDATVASTSFFYDLAGNIASRTMDRRNADGASVTDRVNYGYDLLGRETLRKDTGTGQVNETRYNVYGEITGKRTNGGGGLTGTWQEAAEYDKLGRAWKSNSGDGIFKVHLYDANGNATATIESAGANFAGLTLDEVRALPDAQKFVTISQYDARDQLVATAQPKMSGGHESAAIEQFISQNVDAKFTNGAISIGPLTNLTPVGKTNPATGGETSVAMAGTVSASLALEYFDGSVGSSGALPTFILSDGRHTLDLSLPDTSALGTGNIKIIFNLSSFTGNTGTLAGIVNQVFTATNDQRSASFTFTEAGNTTQFALAGFPSPYVRSYSYSLFKQTTTSGDIPLGSFSGTTTTGRGTNVGNFRFRTVTGSSTLVGKNEIQFRGQPPQADRVIFQFRHEAAVGWTAVPVARKLPNDNTWYAFDWSGMAQGKYQIRYTTLSANGTVLNSKSATMTLGPTTFRIEPNTEKAELFGGSGRAFMASDGTLHILEQGSGATTLTVRYRPLTSTGPGPWSNAVPASQAVFGAATTGWFVFNPIVLGLSGPYEYRIEAKSSTGAVLNRAQGTFTTGIADSVTELKAYQDQEIVHFVDQPPSAETIRLSYRLNGSIGEFQNVVLTKAPTGLIDWDASSLVTDYFASYDYEFQYETFNTAFTLVNKAHGKVRLGVGRIMLEHLSDRIPGEVRISPPQANARQLVLQYRTAGSTGAYTRVPPLTRTSDSEAFVWNVDSLVPLGVTVNLDYLYDLLDAAGAPVKSPDDRPVHVAGQMTLGAVATNTVLKGVIIGSSNPDWTVSRSQTHNAFGEVAQEIDGLIQPATGLGRITDFAYNALGLLTEKRSPETNITLTNGFIQRGRPTTRYAYDLAGRLVAVTDANGNVNRLQLLAGSGLDGGEAKVLTEFHADRSTQRTGYDVFGDARKLTDGNQRVALQDYDKLGRIVRVVHPQRDANSPGNETAAAVSSEDRYAYDQAGNRISRTNALGATERTYYDSLGRVTQVTSFAGYSTVYGYGPYDATILGAGGVQVGGWLKTTTNAIGKTLQDKEDVFGRVTWHKDLDDHTFTYSYNHAGWLTSQAGTGQKTTGQNLLYEYYANGYRKSVEDKTTGSFTSYEYDAEGNRTVEAYTYVTGGVRDFFQFSEVEYDELNRVKRIFDPKAEIRYEYDANSNRRRVWSYYHDGIDGGIQRVQDYWYAYDEMNRFVVTMGQLSGAPAASATDTTVSVGKGTTGVEIYYDAASQRKAAIYGFDGHREDYTYTADGYLEDTKINDVLRARRFNDALGRAVKYQEFDPPVAPSTVPVPTIGKVSEYDADNKLLKQTEYKGPIGGTVSRTLVNDYMASPGTLNDAGPLETSVSTTFDTTGGTATPTKVTSVYSYEWWDDAKASMITAEPFNAIATNPQQPKWLEGFSDFEYDANGQLKQVNDVRGGRAIRFVNDGQGLVLVRDEISGGTADFQGHVTNNGTIDKHHLFYYLDGRRVGDVGNDGPLKISYAEELAQPKYASLKEAYKNWKPLSSADFDQNFEPIGPNYPTPTPWQYTVRSGAETLRSIAQTFFGDAAMWYLIADANGLRGTEQLVAGQTLTIPNKVANIHNTSSTYRVYDPGEVLGDVSPTIPDAPPPPPPAGKHGGGCGGFGGVLVAVIAIAVTAMVAPQLITPITNALASAFSVAPAAVATVGKGLAWAAAGALGSTASQGFSIAAGMQEEFSWKAVATSAIGAGVGGTFLPTSPGWTQIATAAATASVVTQGLNVALGLQQKFDWRIVAASFIAAPIGAQLGAVLGGVGGQIAEGLGRGLVGQTAQKALGSRDQFDYAAIAGNAIGESLVDGLTWDPLTAEDAYAGQAMTQNRAGYEQAQAASRQAQIEQSLGRQGEIGATSISRDRAYAWRDDAMREQALNRAMAALTPQSVDPGGVDSSLDSGLTQVAQVPLPVHSLTGKTMIDASTAGLMQTPGYQGMQRQPEDNLLITPADPKPSLSQQIGGFLGDVVKNIRDFILGTPAEPVNTPQSIIINKEVEKVGPGRLTQEEAGQLQDIADRFNTTFVVYGSRARGEGRFIDQPDVPVGDELWERSDIDVQYDGLVDANSYGRLSEAIKQVGNGAGKANSGTFGLYERPKDEPVMTFKPRGSR